MRKGSHSMTTDLFLLRDFLSNFYNSFYVARSGDIHDCSLHGLILRSICFRFLIDYSIYGASLEKMSCFYTSEHSYAHATALKTNEVVCTRKFAKMVFRTPLNVNAPYSSERMTLLTDQRLSTDLGELVAADVFA